HEAHAAAGEAATVPTAHAAAAQPAVAAHAAASALKLLGENAWCFISVQSFRLGKTENDPCRRIGNAGRLQLADDFRHAGLVGFFIVQIGLNDHDVGPL